MSSTSNNPGDPIIVESSALPRWVIVLFVIAFAFSGYLLYANYQDRQAAAKNASRRRYQDPGPRR